MCYVSRVLIIVIACVFLMGCGRQYVVNQGCPLGDIISNVEVEHVECIGKLEPPLSYQDEVLFYYDFPLEEVDVSSFEVPSDWAAHFVLNHLLPGEERAFYARDKAFVYIVTFSQLPDGFSVVEHADPKSFELLDYGYARDAFAVFYLGKLLEGVDVPTFEHVGWGYAWDKHFVYYRGKKIPEADRSTFEVSFRQVRDADCVYVWGVSDCSYAKLGSKLAKDLGWRRFEDDRVSFLYPAGVDVEKPVFADTNNLNPYAFGPFFFTLGKGQDELPVTFYPRSKIWTDSVLLEVLHHRFRFFPGLSPEELPIVLLSFELQSVDMRFE